MIIKQIKYELVELDGDFRSRQGIHPDDWREYYIKDFKLEIKHGQNEIYYENGNLFGKGFVNQGYKEGAWQYFYEDGKIDQRGFYVRGHRFSKKNRYYDLERYSINQILCLEEGEWCDKLDYTWEHYDKNGRKLPNTYDEKLQEDLDELNSKINFHNKFISGLEKMLKEVKYYDHKDGIYLFERSLKKQKIKEKIKKIIKSIEPMLIERERLLDQLEL